ncbi:hypothetical protein ACO0QE_001002 [Hanseniaspora vineae]
MQKNMLLSQSADSELMFQFNSPIQKNMIQTVRGNTSSSSNNNNNNAATTNNGLLMDNAAYNPDYNYNNRNNSYNYRYSAGNNEHIKSRLSQHINPVMVNDDYIIESKPCHGSTDFDDDFELESGATSTVEQNHTNSHNANSAFNSTNHGISDSRISDNSRELIVPSSVTSQLTMEYPPSYKSNNTIDITSLNGDDNIDSFTNSSNNYNNQNGILTPDHIVKNIHRLSIDNDENHNKFMNADSAAINDRAYQPLSPPSYSNVFVPPKLSGTVTRDESITGNAGTRHSQRAKYTVGSGNNNNGHKKHYTATMGNISNSRNKLLQKNKESLHKNKLFSHFNNYLNERFVVKDNYSTVPNDTNNNVNSNSVRHNSTGSARRSGSNGSARRGSNTRHSNSRSQSLSSGNSNSSRTSSFLDNSEYINNREKWINTQEMVDQYWIYGKDCVLNEDMFESSSDEE